MHIISIIGPTIAFILKIVQKKEFGPKMSGFFQNNVRDPRSQDPGTLQGAPLIKLGNIRSSMRMSNNGIFWSNTIPIQY